MKLALYVPASTANPTGRRPWNSRLSFYVPNSFALPSTGQGPFLLNPGVRGCPQQNGGLGCDGCAGCDGGMGYLAGVKFPNYATFQRSRQSRRRFASNAPQPVYGPPTAVTSQLSGLGQSNLPVRPRRRGGSTPTQPSAPPSSPSTLPIINPPTIWRTQQQQSQQQNQGLITPPIYSGGRWQPQNALAPTAGFTPVGTASSGAQLYTSAPGLESQAAAQGYYQIGTTKQGNPLYTNNPAAAPTAGTITSYDQAGVPIYSAAPAGAYVVGTDAYGNPVYSNNPSAASLVAATQGAAAPAATTTAAAAPTSATSSVSDFLSEDSLGLGLNNGWYLAIGGIGLLLFTRKR